MNPPEQAPEAVSPAAPERAGASAPREAAPPKARAGRPDEFTREVADLFGGVIEDVK